LLNSNKDKTNDARDAFSKIIEPTILFRNLKFFDLDPVEYEMSLNPIRYRHMINTSILKQYLRENMFIGELEIEV